MIGFLTGKISSKTDTAVVVDVAGVGYEVLLPQLALMSIGNVGDEVHLEIYTHFSESHIQLFGFLGADEKLLFKKLISVSGIGPKSALAILSGLPTSDLIGAIVDGNVTVLTGISGIGRKTAERLVVELKDRFKDYVIKPAKAPGLACSTPTDSRIGEATQALMSLGYSETQARRALQGIEVTAEDSVQTVIKKSLASSMS